MKILVAFKDAGARTLLERTLGEWGHEVSTAEDGQKALDALQGEGAPRFMIVSRDVPVLDCKDLCRTIRERTGAPYVYVLLVARKPDDAKLATAPDSDIDDYLLPPVDAARLKHRLRLGRRILGLEDELKKSRDLLRQQATRDSATGLWNRTAILGILQRELARSGRKGAVLSVLRVDLDRFEEMSDEFGHNVADAAVRNVARTVQGMMRPYDSVGRYGEEKFLLVLPGCDAEGGAAVASKLHRRFEGNDLEVQGDRVSIAVRIGSASTDLESEDDVSVASIVRTAQAAMLAEGSGAPAASAQHVAGKGPPPPPYEATFLTDCAGEDRQRLTQLVDEFVSSARSRMESLERMMGERDADAATSELGRLRGHFTSLGTSSLELLAGRLEAFVEDRNWDATSGVLERLESELVRLDQRIRDDLLRGA